MLDRVVGGPWPVVYINCCSRAGHGRSGNWSVASRRAAEAIYITRRRLGAPFILVSQTVGRVSHPGIDLALTAMPPTAGRAPLAVCCLSSAVHCPLFAVRCPLSAVCRLPSAVRCPLSAVRCLLSAVRCLLFAVCCLLSTVCCPLPAVCRPPSAAHCLPSAAHCPPPLTECFSVVRDRNRYGLINWMAAAMGRAAVLTENLASLLPKVLIYALAKCIYRDCLQCYALVSLAETMETEGQERSLLKVSSVVKILAQNLLDLLEGLRSDMSASAFFIGL